MERFSFFFASPNVAGLVLASCIALVAFSIEGKRESPLFNKRLTLSSLALFILCALLALTMSRAAVLALLACAAGFYFSIQRLPKFLLFGTAIPLVAIIFNGRVSELASDVSVITRWDVWRGGICIAMDNPFGVPPDLAQAMLLTWYLPVGSTPDLLGFLSDPITNFVFYGYPGLLWSFLCFFFLIIGWAIARSGQFHDKKFMSSLLVLTVIVFTGLFQYHSYYWWFFLAKCTTMSILLIRAYPIAIKKISASFYIGIGISLACIISLILLIFGYGKSCNVVYDKTSKAIVAGPSGRQSSPELIFLAEYFRDQVHYGQRFGRKLVAAGFTLRVNPVLDNNQLPVILIQSTSVYRNTRVPILLVDPIAAPEFQMSFVSVVNTNSSIFGNRVWGEFYERFPAENIYSLKEEEDFPVAVKRWLELITFPKN
jgi:hypothetical protein